MVSSMALTSLRAGQRSLFYSASTRLSFTSRLPYQARRFLSDIQIERIKTEQIQVWHSRSNNPYFNLAIEHYLLQNSHPESTVLFLYVNRPCVVIGRNQNPWLEVNLPQLALEEARTAGRPSPIELVRRRSGGGTVFHDLGNVNWSVICPSANFTRDKHAEMVARALGGPRPWYLEDNHGRPIGIGGGGKPRVNERHDIVLEWTSESGVVDDEKTVKVSGSAYKLTRLRALHHGTMLLSSRNLERIPELLRSPAEPYIKARGVDSVRSAVANVGLPGDIFMRRVAATFAAMHGTTRSSILRQSSGIQEGQAELVQEIKDGMTELKSRGWIYGQTPKFTFSTHPTEDDPRPRPPLPLDLPPDFRFRLTAYHGKVEDVSIAGFGRPGEEHDIGGQLIKKPLYDLAVWDSFFNHLRKECSSPAAALWLHRMLSTAPTPETPERSSYLSYET
ncbi:putative lipoyltransferase [Apodospora peruviana]|uniref:Putative lipoate-protein ligase A n=1 Tax=Apodospora peruviana TaxID=516989 RepID=A0AAE0M1C5_9PEZI|nr:putative lipoyltransferase [Apodospora peruviana]